MSLIIGHVRLGKIRDINRLETAETCVNITYAKNNNDLDFGGDKNMI